jgi:putative DNA primase/helicase
MPRKDEAAIRAEAIWGQAQPCADHPYLTRKGVQAHGLRLVRGRLAVPLRDADGRLHSLQFIGEDGAKKFLTGGRVRGCYFAIGEPDEVVCIAEGFATAATVREATGHAVAVALDCGNMKPVAEAIRAKLPTSRILLCADDDHLTVGNPGLSKAREAAAAVGGVVAAPEFGPDRADRATDFNDLAQLAGLDVVRCGIDAALAMAPEVKQVSPASHTPRQIRQPKTMSERDVKSSMAAAAGARATQTELMSSPSATPRLMPRSSISRRCPTSRMAENAEPLPKR